MMDPIQETAADMHEELLNRDLASARKSGQESPPKFGHAL